MQMQQQATQSAMAQIQPQLNVVNQAQTQGQQAHDTRNTQLQGWADWGQTNLDNAFTQTRDALNNLVTLQGGVDKSSQDTLGAALRASANPTDEAAARLGVSSPTSLGGVLGSSADANKSAQLGVGAGAGALLGMMGANRSLPAVGLQQNQDVERQRWNAENQGFLTQKRDVAASMPGLVQSSLKDSRDFELAKAQFGEQKANNLFQQYLATQELGLKKKDQTFQQWLAGQQLGETVRSNKSQEGLKRAEFLHARNIDWANVGINRAQVENTMAQIASDAANTQDKKKADQSKLRGEGMAKAMEWLSGYMAPGKGEAAPNTGAYPYSKGAPEQAAGTVGTPSEGRKYAPATGDYQRLFDDALRGMLQYTTRSDALRVLMHSNYPDWRNKAQTMYTRLKRRGKSGDGPTSQLRRGPGR